MPSAPAARETNPKQPAQAGGRQKETDMEQLILLKTKIRTLKIEEDGDFWKRNIKPKIRLRGLWLQQAGFKPGNRVSVNCIAHGVLELRSILTLHDTAANRNQV